MAEKIPAIKRENWMFFDTVDEYNTWKNQK